jgi:hypothetical protein
MVATMARIASCLLALFADMVVIHRVDRDIPHFHPVNLTQVGRLLWLVLAAAHQPDIGPDTSFNAAKEPALRRP